MSMACPRIDFLIPRQQRRVCNTITGGSVILGAITHKDRSMRTDHDSGRFVDIRQIGLKPLPYIIPQSHSTIGNHIIYHYIVNLTYIEGIVRRTEFIFKYTRSIDIICCIRFIVVITYDIESRKSHLARSIHNVLIKQGHIFMNNITQHDCVTRAIRLYSCAGFTHITI